MGQIAQDRLDGSMCSLCGSYFKDPVKSIEKGDHGIFMHGSPVVCWNCWKGLSTEDKKLHSRAEVKTF